MESTHRATSKDIPAITQGMRELFEYHKELTGDNRYDVQINEEQIERSLLKLEYYVLGRSFIRGKDNVILDIWTPSEERGRGQATELIKAFSEGKKELVALVDPRNEASVAFWKKKNIQTRDSRDVV